MTRPKAFEKEYYPWTFRRLPSDHPGRKHAVFVVHGIGQQRWTETAATLRSGFEDALVKVKKWQDKKKGRPRANINLDRFPSPFVLDGYWSDYSDIEETFPKDWEKFNDREQVFFSNLWHYKTVSVLRTFSWFFWRQITLLNPAVMGKGGVSPFSYVLYWVMAPVAILALIFAAVRHPKIITGFLSDVRLYADPEGMIEKAIVQNIDYRVGKKFLSMMGLDWDLKELKEKQKLDVSGLKPDFTRIIWVAHSLGTVISYNVISDLCTRALELKKNGTPEQKKGVNRFFKRAYRFVTLGSPLDKFAFLFKGSLRPWPQAAKNFLRHPGKSKNPGGSFSGWWVNFYSVFDPVSGVLNNKEVYGVFAPRNFHIRNFSALIPGYSHTAYWKDQFTLSYILTRTFGKKILFYKEFKALPRWLKMILAVVAFLAWFGLLGLILYVIYEYWDVPVKYIWQKFFG